MSYTTTLTVPVAEALDPALWAQRYASGLMLGASTSTSSTTNLESLLCHDPAAPKTAGAIESQEQLNELIAGLPADTIRWHLRAALSELELKLGTPMGIVVVKSEPLDSGWVQGTHYDRVDSRREFTRQAQENWYRLDFQGSVISVERVRAYWFDTPVWEISPEQGNMSLLKLSWPRQGSAHILPTVMSSLIITAPGLGSAEYGALQLLHGLVSPMPDVWGVDYTIGPMDKHTRQPGRLQVALVHWVYAVAGILLLSLGGLSRSQGLTNASLSIDGLSKSIGLQASAIYGINSALENAYEKATKRLDWKRIALSQRGLRVRPYGN